MTTICDTATGRPQHYLAAQFCRAASDRCYNFSHPGARTYARLVAIRYVWRSINTDRREVSRYRGMLNHLLASLNNLPVDFIICIWTLSAHFHLDRHWPTYTVAGSFVTVDDNCIGNFWQIGVRVRFSLFGVPSIVTIDQRRQPMAWLNVSIVSLKLRSCSMLTRGLGHWLWSSAAWGQLLKKISKRRVLFSARLSAFLACLLLLLLSKQVQQRHLI